jgi:hypothetical protein
MVRDAIQEEKIIAELIHLTRAREFDQFFVTEKLSPAKSFSLHAMHERDVCFAVRETLKEIENKKDDAERTRKREMEMLTRRQEKS